MEVLVGNTGYFCSYIYQPKNVNVRDERTEYGGGEAVFSLPRLLPFLLPCHFSFNLIPTSQNTFFPLSPSLSYWYSPNLTILAHYKNTHALQTKTVSSRFAPMDVSYPWTFRTQAKMFRTHFRSIRTQPSGRFVPKKL